MLFLQKLRQELRILLTTHPIDEFQARIAEEKWVPQDIKM